MTSLAPNLSVSSVEIMTLRVGTARQIVGATAAVHGLLAIVAAATATPGFLHVLMPLTLAASEARKELQRRRLQSWPAERNRTELDLEREAEFGHVFYSTYGLSAENFVKLHQGLSMPASIKTPCRKTCSSQTALLVLLARMRSSGTLESLGRSIGMNPKRISAICTTTVHYLCEVGASSNTDATTCI